MQGKRNKVKPGQKFGHLTVIKEAERLVLPSGQINRAFLCKCFCGSEKVVRLLHLANNRIISCGCIAGEKHGATGSHLHNVWRGMRQRCRLDSGINYDRYKGRGIAICNEWDSSFLAFKKWALENGYQEGLQIDRINNDGDYMPSNCRFVLNIQNVNNRSVTFFINYNGEKKAFHDVLRDKGISEKHSPAVRNRIKRGWNHTLAIDTPIRKGNYATK